MAADPTTVSAAATTEAVAAAAQSRDGTTARTCASPPSTVPLSVEATPYSISPAIDRVPVAPHQRRRREPLYRPLRIYAIDPAASRFEGAIATIDVPWEPLQPGPTGKLFVVDNRDLALGAAYRCADLDEPGVLIADGYAPSPSDPRFHQQMVYAVCCNVYAAFRKALGRNPEWGFGDPASSEPARLLLQPHGGDEPNAWYDNRGTQGALCFGYYTAPEDPTDRTLPRGVVFTCLSHDIVAHEVTHALLDGLRPKLAEPSGADVVAFHEAFADLVALFQHFSYREVVAQAIRRCRGELTHRSLLNGLAQQFGHTTERDGPMRSAVDDDPEHPTLYSDGLEAHRLGAVLMSAVFEAFVTIYRRKTERYLRLATDGSGVLSPGELAHDLQQVLAEAASKLAGQFLAICIRAIDYCPPVGLTFGDYLRALVTADYDLVPDDPWDYRGALVDAFRRRRIYPEFVPSLSEDALLWHPPRIDLPPVSALGFDERRFRCDPASVADVRERRRQAEALGRFVTQAAHLGEFGLVASGDPRLAGDRVDPPCVESIRTARRIGPDGQIAFDLVTEVTQLRHVRAGPDGPAFSYHGGCTILLGPDARVRYVVLKSVAGRGRLERRRRYLESRGAQRYWSAVDGEYRRHGDYFRRLHYA
ncbi:MAG: hypothetical protein ROZ64_00785 [Burkholderiaceae bacterium]|jgi:hypothetical protein|nr:hypothetical protein [Burkholderiaceae bacterium]